MPDVLIIEDEAISRKALALLLTASGYHPMTYASAEEALEYLSHDPAPHVMLVDVDLPGMTGLELIERLRKDKRKFRAVLLTAAEGERIHRFRRENPVDYMRKPVNFDRLLQLLGRDPDHDSSAH